MGFFRLPPACPINNQDWPENQTHHTYHSITNDIVVGVGTRGVTQERPLCDPRVERKEPEDRKNDSDDYVDDASQSSIGFLVSLI